MAKARPIRGIGHDTTFAEAAAAVVEVRTPEVFERADGVLDTTEIDRVHDMRVATRRLRAALEVFAVCFPKKPHAAALAEVKALADALGTRRDPDVAIRALEEIASGLGRAERPGLAGLVEELREEQQAGTEHLERALEAAREDRLEERLQELALDARVKTR